MIEKNITLEDVNPLELWGVNGSNLKVLQNRFPKTKIVSRGDSLVIKGESETVHLIEDRFQALITHLNKFGSLTESNVGDILNAETGAAPESPVPFSQNVLVYGPKGKIVRAVTDNQKKLVSAVKSNDIVFALGPAGTGKTYTAVAIAVKALKDKEVRRIILARPAVEAGENLGFLPGDLKEKIDPYLRPLYDALDDMLPADKLNNYLDRRVIEIAPMAFMRGRTLDDAFVILDEAQNATDMQLKMFLTRMGPNAKVIITGDLTQIDLPKRQPSGLIKAVKLLKDIKGIKIAQLSFEDVVRHRLVKEIIKAYGQDQ